MPDAVQKQAFKEAIATARGAGAKFPEIVAAQFALESAYGTKLSGAYNPFGQKARASEAGTDVSTHEVVGGKSVKIKAKFKDYASLTEAFEEHVQRWDPKLGKASTLEEAAKALQAAGYATDPDYAKKLQSILRSNDVDPKAAGSGSPNPPAIKPAGSPALPTIQHLNWPGQGGSRFA